MATIVLTIDCEDEADVNNTLFLLFGNEDAVTKFDESVTTFGDFVAEHNFTITRVG